MDIAKIRSEFPILNMPIAGKKLIYLDSAASGQMPQVVIDRIVKYQTMEHANIHRSTYDLGQIATKHYEEVRGKVRKLIKASADNEIIFTSGTTDAINLVMYSYGHKFINDGDEIIISELEHHSNIVPWQMLALAKNLQLKIVPINDKGELVLEEYPKLFSSKTKLVALSHASNALGTINPIKEMIKIAHDFGVPVLIDGAQAIAHMPVDVTDLDCDFYAFSGHKLFGPTGVGVLFGKAKLLKEMPPFKGGGDMILSVSLTKTIYNEIPYKFEAGTAPIMPVIALGCALDYLMAIGFDAIREYTHQLLIYATAKISALEHVKIIGEADNKVAVLSFIIDGVHPHDIGTILNEYGIAVRTGHHCAEPVMQHFNIAGTTRASFAIYNTKEEIDELVKALTEVIKIFRPKS